MLVDSISGVVGEVTQTGRSLDDVDHCMMCLFLNSQLGWKSVTRKLVSNWLKLISGRAMVLRLYHRPSV